jgi:hypothetical protein
MSSVCSALAFCDSPSNQSHMLRVRSIAVLWVTLGLQGCGPKTPTEAPTSEARCPEGQHFDGKYCVLGASSTTLGAAGEPRGAGGAPSVPIGSGGNAESSLAPSPPPASSGGAPSGTGGTTGVPPSGSGGAPAGTSGAASLSSVSLAAPVDITMAAAAGPWIQIVAATHLPKGGAALGAPFAGQFQQGQVLKQRLELTPGRCYTVLAAAPPPVLELRIGFYAVDPSHPETWLMPALLEELDPGNQAVLGPKDRCFRPTEEQRDVWLLLFVDQGQGVAAGQVFQK